MIIHIKRTYDAASPSDGYRMLIDKFWPRGIKKTKFVYDEWNKSFCPPDELRKYFHENIEEHWCEFASKYREWLLTNAPIRDFIKKCQANHITTLTLLYSLKQAEKNHALILMEVLKEVENRDF